MVDRRVQVGGEFQATRFDVAEKQLVQVGLVNRHFTFLHEFHLGLVDVDANHMIPSFGKARARHQPHISCSYDGNVHLRVLGQPSCDNASRSDNA